MLRFKWLGFFEEIPIPFDKGSPRDVTAFLFDKRLVYKDNEKDLVLLRDEYQAFYPENGRRLKHFSTLVDFGVPGGDTSVARTTGLPPAIAGRLVLEGKIVMPGLHIPVLPEIYEPVLAQLEQEGITIEERMEEVG
jgi:saccharopine dehydrogenase-like NADP-dependent oxidoreductase